MHTSSQNSTTDDPLLLALLSICKLMHSPHSAESLTSGLPLENGKLSPSLFIRAAKRAGFSSRLIKRPLHDISNLVLPAVLLLNDNKACVLVSSEESECTVLLTETGTGAKTIPFADLEKEYQGFALFIQAEHNFASHSKHSETPKAKHWFWDVIYKSWPIYIEVLIASLLVNIFAIASPLFVMNVYDRVVPNHALETLWVLAIGMIIVHIFEFIMKSLRSYFIDVAGKRADIILSATIFERILGIKMASRPASVGAFSSNLHDFESFRDFLTSATLTTLVDLPFLIIFLVVIYMIGGEVAFIPIVILPLAIIIGAISQAPLKKTITEVSQFSAQKNALLIESLSNLDSIKSTGAEGQTQKRWEENIGQIAQLSLKARLYSTLAINFTSFLQQVAFSQAVNSAKFCGGWAER